MNFRMRNRSNGRKGLSVAAILATTALCSPSVAIAETPAPVFKSVDDHGVDYVTALPYVAIEEGAIGSGPGRVSLQRIYAEGAGFVDNWTGGMYKVTSGSTVLFYVEIGGMSDTFTYATGNGPYTNTKANGATLIKEVSGKYLYTSSQGVQIEFNPTGSNSATACPGADAGTCAIPISIIQPNGLKFLITWQEDLSLGTDYFRLSSVLSSAGYGLTASYVSNSIGAGPTPNPDWFKRASVTFDNNANHPGTLPTISYAYPNSTTTTVTDPAGRTWTFTTNGSGQLTGVRRPGSGSDNITYGYTSGLVTSATKDGVTNTYGRSVAGSIATMTVTKPLSVTEVVQSDLTLGRPIGFTNGNGKTTIYQYDSNIRPTVIKAPENNYLQYGYDGRGNVTSMTWVPKPSSGVPTIVISASFDATCTNTVTCNKPNTTTDARGKVTNYTYDSTHGGVTSIKLAAPTTGADRPETRFSYSQQTSAQGDLVYMLTGTSACATGVAPSCVGTANESKASAVYNSNLLATSVTRTDGLNTAGLTATNAVTYDPRGNVLTVDGPLSGTVDTAAFKYDSANQLVGRISPDPDGAGSLPNRAIRLTYRSDGQVSKKEFGTTAGQSDANFTAMTVARTLDVGFDSNSRPVTSKLSAAGNDFSLTQISYDALGRVDCAAIRMNTAIYGSLPASACTLGTQGGFGPDRISQNVYDAANQVTQFKVSVGTTDAATEQTLTYTANGLVQTLKDAENNLTTYLYDGHDRLSKTQFPTATPKGAATSDTANYEQLTYENTQTNSRTSTTVASIRNRANETIAFGYDDMGRLTSKNLPGTEPDVTYGYDGLSRLTSASQTGNTLSFSWDTLDRMTSEGGPHGTTSFAYDLANERTGVTYSTNGGGSPLTVNYGWLQTGELSSITQGASTLASYTYDSLGSRINVAFGNGAVQAMTYDPVGRLASLTNDLSGTTNDLTVDNIVLNPASQVTSVRRTGDSYAWTEGVTVGRAYASNGLNQYTASGSVTPTYDTRGNLTAAGGAAYCYSSENLLTKSGTGATCTSPTATLTYDPALRLYEVAGAATTRFAYDGVNAIAEYNGSSNLQRRYVFDPTTGQPLVQYEGAGAASPRYLSFDERGSIVSATDGAGTLLNVNRYDEYGIPQSTNSGRFGYTGQAWLGELGMQYSKARIYSPTFGRFLQTDPIGYAGGSNLYAYVGNDPINLVDPLGLYGDKPPPKCIDICITASSLPTTAAVSWGNGRLDPWLTQDQNTVGDRGVGDCVGDCRPIVITGRRNAGKTPYYFNGQSWVPDPYYDADKARACATAVVKKYAVPILADAVGLIPGESLAVGAVRLGANAVGGIYSAATGDAGGAGRGLGGYVLEAATPEANRQGISAVGRLGKIWGGFGLVVDYSNAASEFENCR